MKRDYLGLEKLFQEYEEVGKRVTEFLSKQHIFSFNHVWEMLTQAGFWKISVAECYGGMGFTWQECIIAIEGFVSTYQHLSCVSLLVDQLSIFYLLSRYGTKKEKELFFPYLLRGEMIDNHFLVCLYKRKEVLQDVIYFKRLIYGILATRVASSLTEKYKNDDQFQLKKLKFV